MLNTREEVMRKSRSQVGVEERVRQSMYDEFGVGLRQTTAVNNNKSLFSTDTP